MVLLVISLSVAAPKIARSIQRDRDLETFHRGMQYRRAIQLYYRKFHAYPPNVEALVNTNDIRFLRKKYKDPITGQDDWKPIAFGQNKTPTAMGFFGQPLAGNASTLAGIGPGGAGGLPGAATPGGAFGGSSGSSGIFGSSDRQRSISGSWRIRPNRQLGRHIWHRQLWHCGVDRQHNLRRHFVHRHRNRLQSPVPAAQPSAAQASSASRQPAPIPRSSSTRKSSTTTSGSSPTTRSPTCKPSAAATQAKLASPPAAPPPPWAAPTFGPSPSGPGSNPGSSTMPPETTPQ